MKKVILEDNKNIHSYKFGITFQPSDEDEDDDSDETYFPDESDVEYAIDTSAALDQDNEYIVSIHKITDKKAVFIIEVTNEETNEYMPTAEDIETTMEYSGIIDEWNEFYVETISKTISRSQYRDEKLDTLLSIN